MKKHKLTNHEAHDGPSIQLKKRDREPFSRCSSQSDHSSKETQYISDRSNSSFSTDRPSMLMNSYAIRQQSQGDNHVEAIEISDDDDKHNTRTSSISLSDSSSTNQPKRPKKKRKKRYRVDRRPSSFTVDRKKRRSPSPHRQHTRRRNRRRLSSPHYASSRSPSPTPTHFSSDRHHNKTPLPYPSFNEQHVDKPKEYDKVSVFWDYENIMPPASHFEFSKFMKRFARVIQVYGGVSCINAYIQQPVSSRHHEIIQGNGIQLVKSPTHRKEAADKCLIADVCLNAVKHMNEKMIFILLSDDGDFMYVMQRLKQMGFYVIWIGSKKHTIKNFNMFEPASSFFLIHDFLQIPAFIKD